MIDETDLRALARLTAIENLLAITIAVMYENGRYSADDVEKIHSQILTKSKAETFPGAPPEIGDILSAEIEEATRYLLDAAAEKAAKLRSIRRPQY